MHQALWKRFLAQADKHIFEAERHVTRLRETIAELERGGHDSKSAREFLTRFEAMLAMLIQDRDKVKAELSAVIEKQFG
jgi:exonuclease VII small subunit